MYSTESTQVRKSWGTKTIKQRRPTDDMIDLLQSALLDMDMDVNDAIILISGHCMQLDYYSIRTVRAHVVIT